MSQKWESQAQPTPTQKTITQVNLDVLIGTLSHVNLSLHFTIVLSAVKIIHQFVKDFKGKDPDALFAEYQSRGLAFHEPLEDTDDGLRAFELKDHDVLCFRQPL